MNKMFLLGLSLFCLLQGGNTKIGKKGKEILCATCQQFRSNVCLKGGGTCVTKIKKGCRAQSYHRFNDNTKDWSFTHAILECVVDICGDSVIYMARDRMVNFCCSDSDKCNVLYSLA